jgi:sulfatase maturation enzyme AslB (radical SAM superfamily)
VIARANPAGRASEAGASVVANRLAIERELSSRALRVQALPYYYSIHLNQYCNQSCIMCMPDGRHPRDLIPFEKVVALYEQMKPFAQHITLIGGEPLMYPWITEVLDLMAQDPVAVTINTNATALTEKIARRLVALHELELKCSIDGATRGTYFKIRGMDCFDRVAANAMRFAELAKDNPRIKLIFHYVVMRENLGEVARFVDFAKPFNPYRIDFYPVRHVVNWRESNNTGWFFDGREQSCEFFRDEYNAALSEAVARCEQQKLAHAALFL